MRPPVVRWIAGFLVLCLYVNVIPMYLAADRLEQWIAYWGGFFALVYVITRFLLRINGISDLGLTRAAGWSQDLTIGFLAGLLVYAVKYALFFGFGKFVVEGIMPTGHILQTLLLGVFAMLFSSILNDVLIRGYVFSAWNHLGLVRFFLPVSTVMYVLTDSLLAGFTWVNIVFSGILGLVFAYSVLKTGSIWMSFGLHWGGNVMFRMMYGFGGQGLLKTGPQADHIGYDLLGLAVTAMMFPLVYLILRDRRTTAFIEPTLSK